MTRSSMRRSSKRSTRATPVQFADLRVGDRVLVNGVLHRITETNNRSYITVKKVGSKLAAKTELLDRISRMEVNLQAETARANKNEAEAHRLRDHVRRLQKSLNTALRYADNIHRAAVSTLTANMPSVTHSSKLRDEQAGG